MQVHHVTPSKSTRLERSSLGFAIYGDVPDVLDNVLHHAIPPDGPGLREVAYGSQKLVVENTCFYAGNRARIDDQRDIKRGLCKYAGSWREYLEKLGVVGRDTSVHPWGTKY